MLVDTGPPDGGVVARLRRAGVRRLDLLVVTHAQADHDGGAAAVLRAMPVGMLLDGRDGVREPLGAADGRGGAPPPRRGRRARGRAVAARRRHRVARAVAAREAPDEHAGADPNDRAIVTEARVGRFRMLLTADAESDVLANLDLEPVDVLKVSHHGSADPGLGALLERLRPRLAAIEVGAHNTYGHPCRPRSRRCGRRASRCTGPTGTARSASRARRRAHGGDPCVGAGRRRSGRAGPDAPGSRLGACRPSSPRT